MVVILPTFEQATGHAHPHRGTALRNDTDLFAAMGKTTAEIAATIAELRHEARLDQA